MSARADDLAQKITGTFRGGPSVAVWAEVLEELHPARAEHAYRRLRDSHDGPLTIARFRDAYRALAGPDRDEQSPNCAACDGTGWIQATEQHHGRDYPVVKPCRNCSAGDRAKATWAESHRPR